MLIYISEKIRKYLIFDIIKKKVLLVKYKVVCSSPLLQYTLEYFLKDYLSNDGVIITDNKNIKGILIGEDIKKPFTKTSLILQLEKISFTKSNKFKKKLTFEEKVENLIDKFKKDLINLIKEHYGKE